MRFSVQLPTDHVAAPEEFLTLAAIGEMARTAEAAGFDAAFVTEHPMPDDAWLASGGHHALDPFVALTAAAATTTTLRLQTHILVLPYRNPFLTAKAAATLDVVSGGRVILGVAAGYLEAEFAALGAPFATRNDVCDEAIRALRRAWTEDGVVLEGAGFRAAGNTAHPRPAQPGGPPIWVGGNSRRAIRRAVELGDGWLPFPAPAAMAGRIRTGALESLDDLAERLTYARAHAQAVGRTAPLDVAFVPFGFAMVGKHAAEPAALREGVARLADLGVTWLTLNVPCRTRGDWCERVTRLGHQISALA